MKNGKNPTRMQRIFMDKCKLKASEWLVVKDTSESMELVNRSTGKIKVFKY